MDAEYFKSWKFALTITACFTVLMTGYKIVTRPDLPTLIAERRTASAFPDGEPSPALRKKLMVEGMTSLSLTSTLEEFIQSLRSKNHKLSWEPENDRSFVLRTTRFDPMTKVTNEIAFQMNVRAPSELPPNDPAFTSGAIAVVAMAINSEMIDPRLLQNFLFQMQTDIELRRQRGTP